MQDSLLIGEEMIPDSIRDMPDYQDSFMKIIDSRSAELAFIVKQISGIGSVPIAANQPAMQESNQQTLSKIVAINNSVVKESAENERDRLIIDQMHTLRVRIAKVHLELINRRQTRASRYQANTTVTISGPPRSPLRQQRGTSLATSRRSR